jgi:hypothetical protein
VAVGRGNGGAGSCCGVVGRVVGVVASFLGDALLLLTGREKEAIGNCRLRKLPGDKE